MKDISERVRRALYHINFVREFAEAIVERKKPKSPFDGHPVELYRIGDVGMWTPENIILVKQGFNGTDELTKMYELAKSNFNTSLATSTRQLVTYLEMIDEKVDMVPRVKRLNSEFYHSYGEKYEHLSIVEKYPALENVESSSTMTCCGSVAEAKVLKPLYFPGEEEFKEPVYETKAPESEKISKPKNKNFFNRLMDDINQKTGW